MAVTSVYAGELIPWLEQRFFGSTGIVLGLGKIFTYEAGTSTPLATHTDANLVGSHTNPIILGADGRPPSPIFLKPQGYKFVVKNSLDVEQYTIDLVENVGQVFSRNLGTIQSAGSKSVASGYTILSTDRLVTVNGAATPSIVNLLAASAFPSLLTIKNVGTNALAVTPNGADLIEGSNTAYSVPASSGVTQPAITLVSDGVSAWYLIASHKVP
jgi:hypothetical protein